MCKPWGNCAVALVRLSSRVESNGRDSSCTPSYPPLLRGEYARGCSVPCSSTSRPLPSRSAGSCSRSASADRAPSTGCLPSSIATLHSNAAGSSVPCSVWYLQASCRECRASPVYIDNDHHIYPHLILKFFIHSALASVCFVLCSYCSVLLYFYRYILTFLYSIVFFWSARLSIKFTFCSVHIKCHSHRDDTNGTDVALLWLRHHL